MIATIIVSLFVVLGGFLAAGSIAADPHKHRDRMLLGVLAVACFAVAIIVYLWR